jgi:aryl-alcohol dehydrogenase-like predicted oxidoreductase
VRLGSTDVNRIGLGTNRLTDTEQNRAFVAEAVAAGVNFIDTAYLYSRGQSEATIGAALAPFPEGVVLATKGGFDDGRPETLRAQMDESLRRLRIETVDLYYLHRVDPDVPLERSIEAIDEARRSGKLRQIGLSEVDVEQIERARRVAPIAAVQNRYSLRERKREDVIDYCEREQILFVPFYPLGGGSRLRTGALEEIAAKRGATTSQIALAWLLSRSEAMVPIPGTLSLEHLRENIAALGIELTDEEFDALRRMQWSAPTPSLPARGGTLRTGRHPHSARGRAPRIGDDPGMSFEHDIRPLFRPHDVDEMSWAFDLSSYEEVSEHAEAIYSRLSDGTMPCDAPWPEEDVERFRQWIDACMPA